MTARKKTTIYLDPDLLRAVKVRAAEEGRHDYEIYEAALRAYLAARENERVVNEAVRRVMLARMAEQDEPGGGDEE
ncbi:MAG TPA: hypothetical protein VMM78_14620 [Thermomicrobiales bacterium]|nr:hypothetical protein [Thermomicrobiales bacterium]